MCAASEIANGKQYVLAQHIDNVKVSHINLEVSTRFAKQVKETHRSNELGYAKVIRGKKHNYISMILNYHSKKKLKVDIACYAENIVKELLEELSSKEKALQNGSLLKVNAKSFALDIEKAELFHSFMIKRIFAVKRVRLNLEPSFMILLACLKGFTEKDQSKLAKITKFLKVVKNEVLTLEANNTSNLCQYLDVLLAVHQGTKGCIGATFSLE